MMKKQITKMMAGLFAVGLMVTGLSTGSNVYAATSETGAAGALTDSDYTLEEMLTYAIEDEYLAQTEYTAIIAEFGAVRPFSNIVKAEATHISLLTPLFETYGVTIPQKDWASLITVPDTLEAAYTVGVAAEVKNIEMYESFLKEEVPDDVQIVFERLLAASEKHLAAFERAEDGTLGTGLGKGNQSKGNRSGNNCGTGNNGGQGNGRSSQGTCLLN
ncbi:MAG: hypothetical protein WBI07_19335 [Mobilitalea sp.]